MDSRAIAALLFIVFIVLINLAMIGVVRALMRPNGRNSPMEMLSRALNPRSKADPAGELRRRIQDLKPDSKKE